MTNRRLIVLLIVLALVAAVAGFSWHTGSRIESPADVAARTAPPTPSPILTPIEARILTAEVITRGTARFERPRSVNLVTSALKSGPGIVTTIRPVGTLVDLGDVLMTASQRPVFVLEGDIPAYRDLVPGLSGADVRQLETALDRLGFGPGEIDGTFDLLTAKAIEDLYRKNGFEPFGPMRATVAELERLMSDLAEVEEQMHDLQASLDMTPLDRELAQAEIEAERYKRAAEVYAKRGAMAQMRANPSASAADRDRANAELAAAEAFARAAETFGERQLARLDASRAGYERRLAAAAEAETRLKQAIATAEGQLGSAMPSDEVVFMTDLPLRVDQLDVKPGSQAIGAVVQVTGQRLEIDASLGLADAPMVTPGMTVEIDEPDLGIKARGTVKRIAATPGSDGVDGYHVFFETSVDDTEIELAGVSLRLTIPVRSSGDAVTAVPVTALSLGADGDTRIEIFHAGQSEMVTVEPGLSAGGFVEVAGLERDLMAGEMVVVGYE